MKATIEVTGIQASENAEKDSVKALVSGEYWEDEGVSYVQYMEAEEVECRLSVLNKGILVTKQGKLNCQMMFQAGIKLNFTYETMYGVLDMQTYTKQISVLRDEKNIKIVLDYELWTGEDKLSENILIVKAVAVE